MHYPIDRIIHTRLFVTPVIGHWMEWGKAHTHSGTKLTKSFCYTRDCMSSGTNIAKRFCYIRECMSRGTKIAKRFH